MLVLHASYVQDFRLKMLERIKNLEPQAFEIFSRNLLRAYGFIGVEVTDPGPDGGIDGYGTLTVGLAKMQVAFQCKRWRKSIGRPKIDQFRGAIQGKCEQGVFFTTSTFTSSAKAASIQRGAVPIVLIDGELILDLMIEKQFGVEVNSIPIYSNALDFALAEEEEA
jgi:restriction system protein